MANCNCGHERVLHRLVGDEEEADYTGSCLVPYCGCRGYKEMALTKTINKLKPAIHVGVAVALDNAVDKRPIAIGLALDKEILRIGVKGEFKLFPGWARHQKELEAMQEKTYSLEGAANMVLEKLNSLKSIGRLVACSTWKEFDALYNLMNSTVRGFPFGYSYQGMDGFIDIRSWAAGQQGDQGLTQVWQNAVTMGGWDKASWDVREMARGYWGVVTGGTKMRVPKRPRVAKSPQSLADVLQVQEPRRWVTTAPIIGQQLFANNLHEAPAIQTGDTITFDRPAAAAQRQTYEQLLEQANVVANANQEAQRLRRERQ